MAKTISELRNQSIQVRDASAAGENTATRVGTVLNDIVGHIEDYENTQSSNNSTQDAKIDSVKTSLNAEIARAKTEESNLSNLIGTERTERQAAVSSEETARIQADNAEKTARQQADNAEQDARIKADNAEKTARENADITLRTMIQTEVSDREKAVAAEAARAKAAEKLNADAIATEEARATAAEQAETTRAKAEEERLQGEIDNTNDNLSKLDDKVNSNKDHLTDEVARLDLTDNEIKAGLEAEAARATAAEEANATAIADEVARAKAAEEANTQAINTLKDKTSEITKEVIKTEEDFISIEDNNGNEVFHLDENGLSAKNVKSNSKDVLTEHQDISGLATKDEVEKAKIKEISSEITEKTDSAVIITTDDDKPVAEMHAKIIDDDEEAEAWTSDDYDDDGRGEKYAKITTKGVSAKGFFDMDGKPIGRTRTWNGKKIIWFGTSIPAQGYPLNCGLALQANVINEAKGSSMARIGNIANAEPTNPLGDVYGVKNYAWQNIAYSLSMTQEEKHDIFLNWNTEKRKANLIAEGYTSEEVVNVKGYGELMGGSFGPEDTDPTQHDPKDKPTDIMNEQYTEFRKKCYATCWNSSTDIEAGFGRIEGKIEKYMNLSDKPALWVLDHSNNDLSANQDTFPDDVFDRHYYIGAINFLIEKIFSFDPRARILLVANYCNDAPNYKRMENAIKKIADYWQLPLFLPSSAFGFSAERKVTTNAYWDKSKVWHDSGFNGTNGYGGDSNIRQLSDGTWVHDISLLNAWMADKIHPSSAETMDYYGKMIAKFIDNNLN